MKQTNNKNMHNRVKMGGGSLDQPLLSDAESSWISEGRRGSGGYQSRFFLHEGALSLSTGNVDPYKLRQ